MYDKGKACIQYEPPSLSTASTCARVCVLVFYVKRSSSGGSYGLLWRFGRIQFKCASRALRDQWIINLRTALKTHSECTYTNLIPYQL